MMEARALGSATGLSVRPVGLGGMPLSLDRRPPEEAGVGVILSALEAGMDLIDTADVYCRDDGDIGHNERLIRTALSQWRGGNVVVATKGGMVRPGGRWTRDGRPEHLRGACEASLRALGVERIPLYQLHAPDDRVPFAESVGALRGLRDQGKIAHVGLSNVSVAQIREAQGIVPIASVQNRCSPFDRRAFAEGVVRHCAAEGIAFVAYSPVGGLHGQTRVATDPVLGQVARRHGATPYQVALLWLLAKSPAMIVIPGASKVESARSSAAAMDLSLSADDMAELDRAFPTLGA